MQDILLKKRFDLRAVDQNRVRTQSPSLTQELEVELACFVFGEKRPADLALVDLNGKGTKFSNYLTLKEVDQAKAGKEVFSPFRISGLQFVFDFNRQGHDVNTLEACLGIDPLVWNLKNDPQIGLLVEEALDLLQKCASRANHDYFHHYTLRDAGLSQVLLKACDPLSSNHHDYSGYEVYSIMIHQRLLQKLDVGKSYAISEQAHDEAKLFFVALASIAEKLDEDVAKKVCPYLATIYTHFYQLSWGPIDPSSSQGKELAASMNSILVDGQFDDVNSLRQQRLTRAMLGMIKTSSIIPSMEILKNIDSMFSKQVSLFSLSFAAKTIEAVRAHFENVESASQEPQKQLGFDVASGVLTAYLRKKYPSLNEMLINMIENIDLKLNERIINYNFNNEFMPRIINSFLIDRKLLLK